MQTPTHKKSWHSKILQSQAVVLVTLGRELAQLGLEIAEYFGSITLRHGREDMRPCSYRGVLTKTYD